MLNSLEWEDIRIEKFPLTPFALFDSFVCTAETLNQRQAAEIQRRREWLAAAGACPEEAADDSTIPASESKVDKYGIDLEEFKGKTGEKPRSWLVLVCFAKRVQMR